MCGYQKTEKLQPQNADNAEWANRDRAGGNCEEEIDLRSGLKKLQDPQQIRVLSFPSPSPRIIL